jgi:hypothetical protein
VELENLGPKKWKRQSSHNFSYWTRSPPWMSIRA